MQWLADKGVPIGDIDVRAVASGGNPDEILKGWEFQLSGGQVAQARAKQAAMKEIPQMAAERAAERAAMDELRAQADAGAPDDPKRLDAAVRLAEMLAQRGHLDELRARAAAGDTYAAAAAERLARRGNPDEPAQSERTEAPGRQAAEDLKREHFRNTRCADLSVGGSEGELYCEACQNDLDDRYLVLRGQGRTGLGPGV